MTNEFAIKVLTELKGYGDKFANIGFDRKKALDMAIKALEQQPCEKCEVGNPCLYCEYDFTEKKTKEPCDNCISRETTTAIQGRK